MVNALINLQVHVKAIYRKLCNKSEEPFQTNSVEQAKHTKGFSISVEIGMEHFKTPNYHKKTHKKKI